MSGSWTITLSNMNILYLCLITGAHASGLARSGQSKMVFYLMIQIQIIHSQRGWPGSDPSEPLFWSLDTCFLNLSRVWWVLGLFLCESKMLAPDFRASSQTFKTTYMIHQLRIGIMDTGQI